MIGLVAADIDQYRQHVIKHEFIYGEIVNRNTLQTSMDIVPIVSPADFAGRQFEHVMFVPKWESNPDVDEITKLYRQWEILNVRGGKGGYETQKHN